MAHQSSNIPWHALVSNLKYEKVKHRSRVDNANLHIMRCNPGQGTQLHYFVDAFASNIRTHSATARKGYPARYEAPQPQDIILDDATVWRITSTVHRLRNHKSWTRDYKPSVYPPGGELCHHDADADCQCPVPYEERRASAFYRRYQPNECGRFARVNGKAFLNLEIVKTLLLYGEMDTIFRICASPDVDLKTWYNMYHCPCNPHDVGWDSMCTTPLLAYLALNVIYCFPELWDPASGMTNQKDYRCMKMYQYMLRACTRSGMVSEVATHPHRRFFGVEDGQFDVDKANRRDPNRIGFLGPDLCGKVSIEQFLSSEIPVIPKPGRADVARVQLILRSRRLPMELVLEIMDIAGYTPAPGRLQVPRHPLHQENLGELAEYLKYCWKMLIRCDMMASALGMEIPWQVLIFDALVQLFPCCSGRWWTRNYEDEPYTFLL